MLFSCLLCQISILIDGATCKSSPIKLENRQDFDHFQIQYALFSIIRNFEGKAFIVAPSIDS